jgi:queuine/archaeosine tRNA-ribosyltransferase
MQAQIRYFIPETDDMVDPDYDFINDVHSGGKGNWENQVFAHQLYPEPNYDGILMSRAVLETTKAKKDRIEELGVHRFLRVSPDFPVMGDCGAFSYLKQRVPPYTTEKVIEYYTRLGFDYGVSVDHLIVTATEQQKKFRYELTIHNAEVFLKQHRKAGLKWEPIGAVQGWDPKSYATAAAQYIKMGYRYLALGGLVRSSSTEICAILQEVQKAATGVKIHLFGVTRPNYIKDFAALGVTSFDSSTPLRRACLGDLDNYWTPTRDYRAIRVQEVEEALDKQTLQSLRRFDQGDADLEEVYQAITWHDDHYDHRVLPQVLARISDPFLWERKWKARLLERRLNVEHYRGTLQAAPWRECDCPICQRLGIEVMIFRGRNRNWRRGFHNTYVFYQQMERDPELV